jgi:hypothetical protein
MYIYTQNLDRNYKNRNIYILPDSQAAIKALGNHHITSKLVWDCHQSLTQLTEHNRVQLMWVPGQENIVVNEMADQLARTGSEHPFTGPEPAYGISIEVAKKAVRDCMNRNHQKKKKPLGSQNWTQRGKGIYTRALCQKNEGSVEAKQRPIKMGDRTIYIIGPKRDEVMGGWRKLHNEELHNLYSSPSINRMIKSRRMRWQGM